MFSVFLLRCKTQGITAGESRSIRTPHLVASIHGQYGHTFSTVWAHMLGPPNREKPAEYGQNGVERKKVLTSGTCDRSI